LSIKIGIILVP